VLIKKIFFFFAYLKISDPIKTISIKNNSAKKLKDEKKNHT